MAYSNALTQICMPTATGMNMIYMTIYSYDLSMQKTNDSLLFPVTPSTVKSIMRISN
jgi:hypothetical protein